MRSSAAAAHLPQHDMLWILMLLCLQCVFFFKDREFLFKLLFFCLSVSCNQSDWPFLTSHINKAFQSTEVLTECFFRKKISHHSRWTLETVIHRNPRRSAVSEIFKPAHLAPSIKPQSKSIWLCFPIWCATWTLTEAPDLHLHDFMHCTAATWLPDWINAWITKYVMAEGGITAFYCAVLYYIMTVELNLQSLTNNK